ncbi:MAG: hypothetical protein GY856_16225 [bacterium]|nr:hypothetical protein [bacterium]
MEIMSLFSRIALLGLAAALLFTGIAAGDAKESYRSGLDAVEAGRWEEAVRHLRQAIAERGEEKGTFRRYLPHYYLGVALAEQGDCRAAIEAWAESESQGQVWKAKEEGAELRRRKKDCEEQLAQQQLQAAKTDAEQAIARARKASSIVERLRDSPELTPTWPEGNPSLQGRWQAADRRLRDALQRVRDGAAQADASLFREAKAIAIQATREFDAVASDARARLNEFSEATTSAIVELEHAERVARRLLGELTELAPYPEQLGRRVAAVESDLEAVTSNKGLARPEELAELKETLLVSLTRLQSAAKGPPRVLTDAAEAYLRGEFEGVVEILAERNFNDSRAAGHTCLLRAASRHALWMLGGEQDAELAEQAAADVAACNQLQPPPEIPPRFFSPRFVRFYQEKVQALAEAPPEDSEPATDSEEAPADR